MPCPDFDISIIKRSENRSAVAAAAYQSGSRLFSEYDQRWKDYTNKREVICEGILLPEHAPPEYKDRQVLWNAVEAVEKNWNSQLARKFRMALPREVPGDQYPEMVRRYCTEQFVSRGMICDYAIHDKGDGNPHVHIQLTMRSLDADGKWMPKATKVFVLDENGRKIRLPSGCWKVKMTMTNDWNDRSNADLWRTAWADIQNEYLARNNREERVDLRSYERQGIDKLPTVHMGPSVTAMERRGVATNIGNLNRDIVSANKLMSRLQAAIKSLGEWIAVLVELSHEIREILKDRQEPTVMDYMKNYFLLRADERDGWNGRANLRATVADHEKLMAIIEYLNANDLVTVEDLRQRIGKLEEKNKSSRQTIRSAEKRICEIEKTREVYASYLVLKKVNAEYQKKHFKKARERFYEEHKSEVDEFRYAYRYLMKHGAEKDGSALSIDLGKLAEEEAQLNARISKADAQINEIASDLSQLRQIRYYLGKVMPEPEEIREVVRTDPDRKVSVLEQLARNRKLSAERKNDTDKRNGTYREELS